MTARGDREVEVKRLFVDPDGADRLIAALDAPVRETRHQVNHVFDTDDGRLRHARFALRLRVEDGAAYLTAKDPGRDVVGFASRLEAETSIATADVDDLLTGQLEPLCVLRRLQPQRAELWDTLDAVRGCRPVRLVGSFENRRRIVDATLPDGRCVVVELDRTRFSGGHVDAEVEIEVSDEGVAAQVERWLDALAAKAGVALRSSTPKIARFYEAMA